MATKSAKKRVVRTRRGATAAAAQQAVNDRLSGELVVPKLLELEKNRRGVAPDTLVFVGIANIAQHWWCAQQAVYKSRENEQTFFRSYLEDRLSYAIRLGLIDALPADDAELLTVGESIALKAVDGLIDWTAKKLASPTVTWVSDEWTDADGQQWTRINPALPIEEIRFLEQAAMACGKRVAPTDARERGRSMHVAHARNFPTIRWNFSWGPYVVVGVPDGMGDDFVYEYKSPGSRFLLPFSGPVANAQADLYGYFFRRSRKVVELHVKGEPRPEITDSAVSVENAAFTLTQFASTEAGELPKPPIHWKCRNCTFNAICPIRQDN